MTDMPKDYCTPLTITQIEQNFADLHPALTSAEALHEANRCLYCFDAPCMHACPTHIDIPGFIKKIATGNLTGSARVIFDANPVGATCARVCPVEALCEGACVEKTLLQKPIEIGRLQRYATDHALTNNKQLFHRGQSNGKSVGIVGSGPAGLSCATYLARLGYDVTIYDRKPLAGGLDTFGMAEYKMTQAVSQAEVDQVAVLGVKFVLNTEITDTSEPPAAVAASADGASSSTHANGSSESDIDKATPLQTVSFADLQQWHDAVFLAVGLGATNKLNIPGEDLTGVYDALHFIEHIKSRDWRKVPLGRTVVVIGAGNTAIDAVTQAKRIGAERVIMVYRRSEKDIPAYDYEYDLAKRDGVEFIWQAAPIGILSENGDGTVSSLRCERTDGSLQMFDIPCDMIIKAIGQTKMSWFFTSVAGVAVDGKGRVIVNELMQTSNPKIFAGGDCANGGAEAVDAAQMGKHAAQGIHRVVQGEAVEFAGSSVRPVAVNHVHSH